MNPSIRRWVSVSAAASTLVLLSTTAVVAVQVRPKTGRFDSKIVADPTTSIDVVTTGISELPATNGVRAGWERFRSANGPWTVHLDRRSGSPLLVEGQGIQFPLEQGATVESIGTRLRAFIAENKSLLKAEDDQLVVDRDASGKLTPDVWQVVFKRTIAGVPVVGERYVFTVGHGNLIAFGAPRWSRIDASPFPTIDATEALGRLTGHMGLTPNDSFKVSDKGSLQLIPLKAMSAVGGPYKGPVGAGYASALVWRLELTVDGELGTWAAMVDAHTGEVRSFGDTNHYAQAKGGVYPLSSDGIPPNGVEQANWPMPYTDIDLGDQITTSTGMFDCTPGASVAMTTLAGPYVRIFDSCGPVNASVTCDADLNLGTSGGTDCSTPGFGGGGNTHTARTGFYHLNRMAEHARTWLPSRIWLTEQVEENVNLNQSCNAYWLGSGNSINVFKSGGNCRNTGELAGILNHEWGHGLDLNDGGGYDNPTEAYADITSLLSTHESCIGRGFYVTGTCAGYGDTCLSCTGVRDQNWDARAAHEPATPAGFVATFCPTDGTLGPCGREFHCEAHVAAETLWDLATRDLPASGLDAATAWQLADKLFYKSRLGSGGNAYNCAIPNSDGCAATSWFAKLRAIDDDDGNLANGTPHAAAIFGAFNRHKIACGLASDPSNQSTSTCPSIAAPVLSSIAGSGTAILSWTSVANAVAYNILRTDDTCDGSLTSITTVGSGTTNFTNTGLANGFTEYYRVQALGANPACDGLLSNCATVTPQPFAGVLRFDQPTYSCVSSIAVKLTDGNVAGSTATVSITSGAEPGGESITVTRIAPGGNDYAGTILTTTAAAAADGKISVVAGDTITGTYIDANDGIGGVNIPRQTTASTDCVSPVIGNVQSSLVTGRSARITWSTNEPASSVVHYGVAPPPPGTTAVAANPVTSHVVDLSGLSECSAYAFSAESADNVGNTALDNAAGAYYTFATVKNTTPAFDSTDTPAAIPDNNSTGTTSTVNVPQNKPVVSVKVTVNITHPYVGDLLITLIPPAGAPITLFDTPNSSLDDLIDTVFDDAAATSITDGTAPYSGSFRPVSPLSAANGINAAGAWRLKVVDTGATDVGTLESWTLSLVYPPASCGPHALVQSSVNVTDTCSGGGAGSGDSKWDPGERVSFKVKVNNDGSTALSNVTATITSTTPGVGIVNGAASYPNIASGGIADSIAPHFTASLPTGLACNSNVAFDVAIHSDQGNWNGTFNHTTGVVVPGGGTALNESFGAGIPASWTIVDGGVGGAPAAQTWTAANPGARPITAPLAAPVAIVDSDASATSCVGVELNEELITPLMNLSLATSVTLQFDQWFRWYATCFDEAADVDVRSSATGGAWVTVLHQQGGDSPNPDHQTIGITAQTAGTTNAQVRFHYYDAHWEWFWMVDNVRVDYATTGGCNQVVCAAAPNVAKPVADGSFGAPMTASRSNPAGTTIAFNWDITTCWSTDYHLLYGNLASVAVPTVSGSVCNLGASGTGSWSSVPAGSLWFVVVGDDDLSKEGSWGLLKTGGQRGGASVSGQCGMTTRDNAATCP